jgi:hypothetical protein
MTDERDPGQQSDAHPSSSPQTPSPTAASPAGSPDPASVPGSRRGKGLAIAALVLGVVAFLGAFIPFVDYVVVVPALVAIVLGIIALVRRSAGRALAWTGLVLGVVGLVLSIVLAVVYTNAFISAVDESSTSAPAATTAAPPTVPEDQGTPAAPSATPAAPSTATGATADDPLPIGTSVTGRSQGAPQWIVSIGAPTLDATAAVLAANPDNTPPAAGMQYATVPVTAEYVGSTFGSPQIEIDVQFVGADGTVYPEDELSIAPADALRIFESLDPSTGPVTGNVVVAIPTGATEGGVWAVRPGADAETTYFTAE